MAQDLVTRLTANNTDLKRKLQESKAKVLELENSVRRLNNTQRTNQNTIRQLGLAYNRVSNLNRLLTNFRGLNNIIPKLNGGLGNMRNMLSSVGAKAGVYAAALAVVVKITKENVRYNMDLDRSLSSLKAITGASAETMERFRDAAIELGRTTPQSASLAAEAFLTIAQMKPEIAQNTELLVRATDATLALANASGTDMAEAADIVTRALNVYGVSARYASQYVNVLAAGCRNGSGDIKWLGEAFGVSGATAKAVNMTYEDTITTLELLSRRIKDSTSAGAQLRNVLIYLEQTNDNGLKPSVVGISLALKNLKDKLYDLVTLTKMFKKQNVEAATTLIEYADEFDNLRTKITGTNTAFEMAETRTNTLAGALDELESAWEGLMLTMGNSTGIMASVVRGLSDLINAVAGVSKVTEDAKKESMAKTDSVLFKMAYKLAEDGKSRDEVKAQLSKAIDDRKKMLEDLIATNNNKKVTTIEEQAVLNVKNKELTGQILALEANKAMLDSIMEDAFSQHNTSKEGGQLAILELYDLEKASLSELELRLERLKKLKQESNNPQFINKYNLLIDECVAKIKEQSDETKKLKNILKEPIEEGTVGWYKLLILELDKLIQKSKDAKEIQNYLAQQADYQKEIDTLTNKPVEIEPVLPPDSIADLEQQLSEIKAKIQLAVDPAEIAALKEQMETKLGQLTTARVNAGLESPVETPKIKDMGISKVEEMKMALTSTGDIVNSVGEAFTALGGSSNNTFGIICSGLSTAMSAITQFQEIAAAASKARVSQNNKEASSEASKAIAGGASSVNGIPFPYNIAALSVVMGVLVSMLSMMGTFATGGIVGGNSFSGDHNIVRVNSGEMILNKSQLSRLFNTLNSGGSLGGGNVSFRISGKDLVGTLSNYNSRNSKLL